MKKVVALFTLGALCCSSSAHAQTAPDITPSDASIRQLLEVTQAKNILESSLSSMDSVMLSSMKQATNGLPLGPEQEKIMADMRAKMTGIFREEMRWELLEPMFVSIYRNSYTQSEVDGMNAFYNSPAGQAVTAKTPLTPRRPCRSA